MPLHHPIVVEVDCPEPRVLLDTLYASAGGKQEREAWAMDVSTGVWRSPVRRHVCLQPLPTTAAWRTTTTGNYARLRKTDYTLTTAGAWVEQQRGISGNYYLEGNGTNERVTTAASYPADQPWFLSIYVPGVEGLHEQTILECGWGAYGGSSTVWLRIRANGKIAIFKGSTQIGYDDVDFAASANDAQSKALGLKTVNLLLMPQRILNADGSATQYGCVEIVSDLLTGFIQQFDGLASGDAVVPAGVFWWQVPAGRPAVQLAPLKFETSGTLYGPIQPLRYAPDDPQSWTSTPYYTRIGPSSATIAGTYALAKSDGSSYTPDGVTSQVRAKAALTGDGAATYAIEALDFECLRVPTTTYDGPVDITGALSKISWSVDDHGVAQITLEGKRGHLEAAGVQQVGVTGDRPFRLYIVKSLSPRVEIDLIRGVLSKPVITVVGGLGVEADSDDSPEDLLTLQGKDRTFEFENYMFVDAVADDGRTFVAAMERAVTKIGVDTGDLILSSNLFTIERSPNISTGEWNTLAPRGTLLSEHLDKYFDTFAANWWRGWVPTLSGYKWRSLAPSDMSTSPAVEIYESREDALADGMLADQVQHRTVRKITRHPLASEANQVIVVGNDPVTRRTILSQTNDAGSQNPATAPASRPPNWRSRPNRILLTDPSIQTTAQADTARDAMAGRTLHDRHMADIECDLLIRATDSRPLWTSDVLRLWLKGGNVYEDFRIVGIPEVEHVLEYTAAQVLTDGKVPKRQATYRCERIGTGP